MRTPTIGVIAVVVMLVLSGGVAMAVNVSDTENTTPAAASAAQEQPANASITFDDQTVSNDSVTVQNATLAQGGYIAIHTSEGGELGEVVGSTQFLEAGTHENVTVTLDEGVNLSAVASGDGATEMPVGEENETETPVSEQNETEMPAGEENTTETPVEENATETASPGEPGAPTETPSGEEETPVDENTTDTETVPTDDTESANATTGVEQSDTETVTLVAVAHMETNQNTTFDFASSDGEDDTPYLVDGEPVSDDAEVTLAQAASEEEPATEENETETPVGEQNETEMPAGEENETETPVGENETEAPAGADDGLVVERLDAPRYAAPGGTITVNATVNNTGGDDVAEDVAFRLEGGDTDMVLHETVRVNAGETANVSFEVDATDVSTGEYVYGVTTYDSSEFEELTVTDEAAVEFGDQSSNASSVVVNATYLPEGGYVVVHATDNGSIGSVVGSSEYLEAGYHENVTVELAENVSSDEAFGATTENETTDETETDTSNETEVGNETDAGNATTDVEQSDTETVTLVAMAHMETNQNETFDFVTSDGEDDGPYVVDGEPVTDDAEVTLAQADEGMSAAEEDEIETDEENVTESPTPEENATETNETETNETETPVSEENETETPVSEENETETDTIEENETETPVSEENETETNETETNETETPVSEENETEANATEGESSEQVNASVTFGEQTTENDTVVVENVTLGQGGYVAVHDDTLVEGNVTGSVIGVSEYLEAGTHENVTVTLYTDVPGATFDDAASADGTTTLIAMAHMESNQNEAFDFVTSDGVDDGPYVVDGEPVTSLGSVTFTEQAGDGAADDGATEENETDAADTMFTVAADAGAAELAPGEHDVGSNTVESVLQQFGLADQVDAERLEALVTELLSILQAVFQDSAMASSAGWSAAA